MRSQINLEVKNLSVRAKDGSHAVLSDVSLELLPGKLTCAIGESGAGKTTVLSAILGLLPDGLERVDGTLTLGAHGADPAMDLVALTPGLRRIVLGRRISYVPQDCLQGLDPLMPVGRMLYGSLRCHSKSHGAEARAIIHQATLEAGLPDGFLDEHAARRPGALSGGQRQRLLLANARIHRPQVVLYDEPTTALDAIAKRRVLDAIKAGIGADASALVVTHDLAPMLQYADMVYVLYAGRIVECGTSEKVLREPGHPYTRDLLRCLPQVGRRMSPAPIGGRQPSLSAGSRGCQYCDRCAERLDRCASIEPDLKQLDPTRGVRCHARF